MSRVSQLRPSYLLLALVLILGVPLLGVAIAAGAAQDATPPAMTECPDDDDRDDDRDDATPDDNDDADDADDDSATTGSPVAAHCVEVELDDIYFEPNLITIPADTPVTFVLHNEGETLHNFSITDHGNEGLENLDISVNVEPGQTQSVTIDAPAGDYYFFCDQPGHEQAGMRGYLNVEEGAEIETEEATVTPRAG